MYWRPKPRLFTAITLFQVAFLLIKPQIKLNVTDEFNLVIKRHNSVVFSESKF